MSAVIRLMKFTVIVLLITSSFVLAVTPVTGQEDEPGECATIVATALDQLDIICDTTGSNEACYGHFSLQARPQPDVVDFTFDEEGDIESIINISSLRLAAMNVEDDIWGLAMLRLQPDPSIAGNITILLFGDVELANDESANAGHATTLAANFNVNVRLAPSTEGTVLASISPGTEIVITGRLEDNSWVSLRLPETETIGWISSELLAYDFDFEAIPVVSSAPRYYGPMQAVQLESGMNDAACAEQPNSGILIQTPEGSARVTLLINEVNIQFDSTIFLQADPDDQMVVSVVDGTATVTANGTSQNLVSGTQSSIPLDNGSASGIPGFPQPYPVDNVSSLPVDFLDRPVVISDPVVVTPPSSGDDAPEIDPVTGEPIVSDPGTTDPATGDTDPTDHPLGGPPGQTGEKPGKGNEDD